MCPSSALPCSRRPSVRFAFAGPLFALAAACGSDPEPGPQVTDVFPAPNAVGVATAASPTVAFDIPVDPASLNVSAITVFGRWSGPMPVLLGVDPAGTTLTISPQRPFFHGELVTIAVGRGAAADESGNDIDRPHTWSYWTNADPGTLAQDPVGQRSVRLTGEGQVKVYGAYAGDLDRDGFSDLVLPTEMANDVRILLNDGAGAYGNLTVFPVPSGAVPSTNEGGDFDRDGNLDLAVGNTGNEFVSVFFGNGDGTITHNQNVRAAQGVRDLCVGDFDGDGTFDIVTASREGASDGSMALLTNDGIGNFSRSVALEAGSMESACVTGDFNGDGFLDFAAGAFGSSRVTVFKGNGAGGFTREWDGDAGGGPWMLAGGDLNGDGTFDVVSVHPTDNSISVLLGDGSGRLALDATYATGTQPIAVDIGDLDGDGDLDVVVSNAGSADFSVYENRSGTLLPPIVLAASSAGSYAVLHDRDGDGDVDITGIDDVDDLVLFFENR